ncbi:MAG TPA: ABC transporter ATP-binding protein [Solirubrobacteraceae bacterium]|nr:ABC transporter ATP-binding protein [Solirubrobacteraceae bacterium]
MAVADPPTDDAVVVRDLRIELVSSGEDIVDQIVLEVTAGQVLGLVGESGSGKTTVGMALLGYCRPGGKVVGGEVVIDGRDLQSLREGELRRIRGGTVSYIPQDPGTALNPALRIGRQLSEMLEAHAPSMDQEQRNARVREALEEVALPPQGVTVDAFLARYPHQLSGGQQQRVAIAMAFANRPHVIVCDEPTTGLDVTTQARVLQTVRELCQEHGVAALYVSHDLAVVAELADEVAVMYSGRIVERGPRDVIFSAPRHPYTRRLLRAIPDLEGKRAVVGIPGRAPLPGNRPSGCFFTPRCDLAIDKCSQEFPAPRAYADGKHLVCCYRADDAPSEIKVVEENKSTAAAGDVVLAVSHVDASYGSNHILHDVDFEVRRNECVALVGESGSGKTTTARCVAGLHRQYTGEIKLDDVKLAEAARSRTASARKRIQYVFQNPYASLNPRRTIGQTLARQLHLFPPEGGTSRATIGAKVAECLERVALSRDAASRYPDQLSGGERQRVAVARALAAEPALLICDEITSALDVSVQAAIVELLRELREQTGLSMLFITHNLALIRTIADRVIVMTEGKIVESGDTVDLFEHPKAEYTQRLLANTPTVENALDTGGRELG